jgi:hypothetical protein
MSCGIRLGEFMSLNRNISTVEMLSYVGIMNKVNMPLCLTNWVVRHEDVWGSGCIDPRPLDALDLGTSCRWVTVLSKNWKVFSSEHSRLYERCLDYVFVKWHKLANYFLQEPHFPLKFLYFGSWISYLRSHSPTSLKCKELSNNNTFIQMPLIHQYMLVGSEDYGPVI